MDSSCEFALGATLEKRCYVCAAELSGRRTKYCSKACSLLWLKNHFWTYARRMAKRRDKYKCVTCGSKEKLEVNHINPLVGTKRSNSCKNHQVNLETLCRSCHLVQTNIQRKARRGKV